MKKPEIKTIHIRKAHVLIDKEAMRKLVKEHAIAQVGFYPEATEFEIKFQDATEGSPAYRVGTECVVVMTEDQTKLSQAEDPK